MEALKFLARTGRLLFLLAMTMAPHAAPSQSHPSLLPSPDGLIESGVPDFAISGYESIGLSTTPTDLVTLSDGRIILAAYDRILVGDGIEWEVYYSPRDLTLNNDLMVGDDDTIYTGVPGGVARVVFNVNGQWYLESVLDLPEEETWSSVPVLGVTRLKSDWLWDSGSGPVFFWTPGALPKLIDGTTSPLGAFELNGRTYIMDSVRNLRVISEDRLEAAFGIREGDHRTVVSAATRFDEDRALVGTTGQGFFLYDGRTLHPFPVRGAPQQQLSISALVRINENLFAAAADGSGVLIFDASGQVIQELGREMDHRLNAVRKLFHRDGILWGLLTEGILRVEIPSPISHFAPMAPTSFQFSRPTRHDGRLWVLADGVALRAEYSDEGRLTGLVRDTPPGSYVWTLASVNGAFLACNELGIYRHAPADQTTPVSGSWIMVRDGIVNARIEARDRDGRWFYVANGEMGWIDESDPFAFESYETPELGDVYGTFQDSSGTLWCELGAGLVGRVNINADLPTLTILDTSFGLPPSWVQIWHHHNEPRFSVGGRIMFFDPVENRFRDDDALVQRHPDLAEAIGRPAVDAFGRLWMSAQGTTIVENTTATTDAPEVPKIVGGIRPIGFVMEENGVVWLQSSQRLTRFDPYIPPQPLPAVKPVITRISLPNDGTVLFPPFDDLVLPHVQNSLVVHFLAPHNPFRQDVSFRLNLEGGGNTTVPHTGGGRSATFSQLGGGMYQLNLQALVGDTPHATTSLAFTILPPWYRSTLAYVAYAAAAVLLPLAVGAAVSYLNRREQERLKELVSLRTAELEALNSSLEERVSQRTAELESANKELESFSYSVSHDLRAPLRAISGFSTALMDDYPDRLGETGADFLRRIHAATGRMEELIDAMLSLSRVSRHALTPSRIDLSALVNEIVSELKSSDPDRKCEIVIEPDVTITADPPLIRVVMENLLGNAWKYTSKKETTRMEFRTESHQGQTVYVVKDNGAGFDSSLGGDPFAPFQRMHTKDEFEGIGIGLANVQKIIHRHGGRVWAEGTVGEGATFRFTLG